MSKAELLKENAELRCQVAKLFDRVKELEAVLRQKKQPPASPPKAPEPLPTLTEKQRKAYENRPIAPPLPEKPAAPAKPRRPTGRKALPEHLPAETHELCPEACQDCGRTDFEWVDEVVEAKLHVVQSHQRQRVVRRKTGCCKHCGTRTTARSLPAPFARSKATCEWLAWLVHQKFSMLLPLDRVRRDLKTKGIPLAMSYLVTQIERAADLLGAVDGEHW